MAICYRLSHASGLDSEACSCLVHRWDDDVSSFASGNGESFVCDFTADGNTVSGPVGFHYTNLWRSESGTVYASHRAGQLHIRDTLDGKWRRELMMDSVYGVWGLDEECVYAWGDQGGKPAMQRFDGEGWRAMPAPPAHPNGVHAVDQETLTSVATDGSIARFDGKRWVDMRSPVDTSLSSVFVVDADRAYACGPYSPVLARSGGAWTVHLRHPGSLHAVALWKKRLYVAAGSDGLLVERDGALALAGDLDPLDLQATKLDARGDKLVVTSPERVADTSNGKKFVWWDLEGVIDVCKDLPPRD